MNARRLLFLQLFIVAIVAVLHLVGTALYLYWMFWWYDILVHFLASIWVALAATWIALEMNLRPTWAWALGTVLIISLSWEVFEFYIGATDKEHLLLDTSVDMLMNMLGGGFGVWFVRRGQ